jgi:hypothetical protein
MAADSADVFKEMEALYHKHMILRAHFPYTGPYNSPYRWVVIGVIITNSEGSDKVCAVSPFSPSKNIERLTAVVSHLAIFSILMAHALYSGVLA